MAISETPKLLSARNRLGAALLQAKQTPFTPEMLATVSKAAKIPPQNGKKTKQGSAGNPAQIGTF